MAKRATREAFGETLVELANEGMNVCAVDADLAGSTTTNKLQKAYPDRFVDVGIAEQDMIGVAAGLSLTGRIPFTASFAVFGVGRCYDQIRNTVCDSNLNVKVCPTQASHVLPDGTVQIDKEKCIGCQFCVMACPYNVRYLNEAEGVVEKCTMCEQLIAQGGLPQCVSQCVGMAKYFGDLDADPSMLSFRGGYNTTLADCGREFTEADIHHLKDVGNGPSIVYILRDKKWQGGE